MKKLTFNRLVVSPIWLDVVDHVLIEACAHDIHVFLISLLISAHSGPPIVGQICACFYVVFDITVISIIHFVFNLARNFEKIRLYKK